MGNQQSDSLIGVIQTLWRWRKSIAWVCGIAAIGSIVICLAMSDYYMSTTSFYVMSPDQSEPNPIGDMDKEGDYYGNEDDIDRILTIAQSNEVASYLIDKYDLYEHYDIDTSHIKAPSRVRKRFFKLYDVMKTKYSAIEISMEDTEPELAATLVNDARGYVNQLAQNLMKNGQAQLIQSMEKSILEKQLQIQTISDTLGVLRQKYGIYASYEQAESLPKVFNGAKTKLERSRARLEAFQNIKGIPRDTINFLKATIQGLEREFELVDNQLNLFNEGVGQVQTLDRILQEAQIQLSADTERLKQLQAAYQGTTPAILVVEEGEVPVEKSRPVRTLIVVASVFIAFLLSIIGILLIEAYREVNWKEVFTDGSE